MPYKLPQKVVFVPRKNDQKGNYRQTQRSREQRIDLQTDALVS